jgi:NAD(P)-dependent dehydrogenase (short-subunit alcohol dehydrogenase family)
MVFQVGSIHLAISFSLILGHMLSVGVQALACEKTALVTGSTDGIGLVTAKNLAAKGLNVLIHGRDERRIGSAVKAVMSFQQERSSFSSLIIPLPAQDLCTVTGCEKLVIDVLATCQERNLKLHVLMNNAGVYSQDFILTSEGLELELAVNVVAPFVITSLLLGKPLEVKSRIVIASSISQCGSIRDWEDLSYGRRSYSAHAAYSESKLLDAMLTMEFADRLKAAGFGPERITCNCLDPGTVNTKMLSAGWGRIGIEVEDALDETWLCTSPEVEEVSGESIRRHGGHLNLTIKTNGRTFGNFWQMCPTKQRSAGNRHNYPCGTS